MKPLFYLLCLIPLNLNAQSFSELGQTISELDLALVKKDTVALNLILHERVSVTHSNGFTEDKSKMKQNTISSFITYNKISQKPNAEFIKINDLSYIVYRFINVQGIYDIYDFTVDLRLMEVWVWEEDRWQLIGRQSLELENK